MVHALGIWVKRTMVAASLAGLFAFAISAQEDPPTRVARLNYMNGNVSMEPAGVDDWAPAVVNRPFTTGDYIYTDDGAQAELHMDIAVIRMGPQTSFGFLNLGDQMVQLKMTEGDMYIRLRHFSSGQVFEVDTPNGAVTLLQNGVYRFRVDPNGQWSYAVVREGGQAQVTGGGQAFILDQNESANVSGTDQISYDVEAAPAADDFDNWCSQRDAHEASLRASQYVSDSVIGYEDLDDNGDWSDGGEYGQVWYPRGIEAGWAPYHNGHWAWIDPWGWTWNDDASWGFAPFHYGRWVYYNDRWGWAPGPREANFRPYYAPAMVAWFGGSHFGVSIGIGGGPALGWVPLGYGEVYTPPYTCSQRYFSDVNIYNTRVTNVNITNVYNTVYVQHTTYNQTFVNTRAPNAVMSMPQSAFAGGQPVARAARAIPAAQVAQIQTARVIAPPVAPTRQSVMPSAVAGRAAPHPPAQVMQRSVVARVQPPAPPAPFASRQQYLAQHATTGQPINHAEMARAVPAPRVAPAVHVVSAAPRPTAVRPGARVGNPVVASRPGTVPQPGHVTPAASRPGTAPPAARPEERTAPQPAAHGAPPNRPAEQPAARTPQPPPARPEERTAPQPAAHGAPPNRPAEQPAARTPQPPPARPEERPAAQPAARTPQPPPARPEERTAPQPAAHGAPPNRPAEQPAARTPQPPPNRPAEKPAPARPEERPAAQPAARTPQPPPAHPAERPAAPPPSRPAPESRPAPAPARPEAKPAPAPARPEAKPAPAPARPEAKPAPAEHGTPPPAHEQKAPPKNTKETKDTKP